MLLSEDTEDYDLEILVPDDDVMVGGISAWPVISTVTSKPVSLITANGPRLIPEGSRRHSPALVSSSA